MRISGYAFLGLVLLTACEGSGDGGADGGGSRAGLSGLVIVEEPGLQPTELSRALCAKMYACGTAIGALTQDDCALYYALPCLRGDLSAEDGLAECVAAIGASECGEVDDMIPDACWAAFARARARASGIALQTRLGGECGDGIGCDNGMFCTGFGNDCGSCIDLARVGDPCGSGCFTGYCEPATNQCVRQKADGEWCTDAAACKSGFCSATGLCKPVAEPEICAQDQHCRSGYCADGKCRSKQPPGEPCTSGADCENDHACDDGVCKVIASCALGNAGERCGPLGCGAELGCMNGMCVGQPGISAPRAPDWPCDADEQCESGACVSFSCGGGGTCGP